MLLEVLFYLHRKCETEKRKNESYLYRIVIWLSKIYVNY